jgi:hypothetical protein
MSDRHKLAPRIMVSLFIAFMGLAPLTTASSPRFAAFQAIDVFRLITSGMCFGAGLAALLIFVVGSRSH